MTNNEFDDLGQPIDHEEEHVSPVPAGFRANITEAWKSQPLFKLFVLMVVVGAIVAVAIAIFSGGNSKSAATLVRPPDLHEAPGGKATPYLKEQTEMANREREKEALQGSGSAIPTPVGPSTDAGELNPLNNKEDPLNELRAEVENMNKQLQETKAAAAAPQPQQAPPEAFDDSLAQAMQRQMSQLLDSWAPKSNKSVAVYDMDVLMRERQKEQEASTAATNAAPQTTAANQQNNYKTILPAGTVSYAQLLTEANSDVKGPILAQIVSGPLKGARAVGRFEVQNGYNNYLVLTFTLANLKGIDYRINALALDPDTTLGGMATEVDQRYLTRLVLPAAAGFLQGFASALSQGNTQVVLNGTTTIVEQSRQGTRQGIYSGIGAAANTASQFFQNQANNTQPLVRVAAGTPMGLFFIETVTDQPLQQNQQTPPMPYYSGQPYGGSNGSGYYDPRNAPTGGYGTVGNNVPYPNYGNPAGYNVNYGGLQMTPSMGYPNANMYYPR